MPETPARPVTIDIEVRAADGISSRARDIARRKIQALERRAGDRDLIGHIALRRGTDYLFVADASVTFEGRVLAAHAAARSPEDAVDAVIERLERQMRRVVDADVALRNILNHRSVYFTDANDGRGRVLYLRHDGDYGLVEPE
jgi:ribosome-associated translation inhibitor RaiA